ncbi:MAG: HPr family phosphocarrier protein [Opitutales bacterium]
MSADSSQNAISRVLTVRNKMGIHARPAAMIVRVANRFSSDIWVEKDGEQVNGKSIMGLMMLAAGSGSELTFTAEGPDAQALLDELTGLFDRKFEET